MIDKVRGTVHGRTIEVVDDLGLPDGEKVEITIQRVQHLPGPPPGWQADSKQSAAGMMADDWSEADDKILAEIHQGRKQDTRPELTE
jgi:hypothetical protein